jgi:hypothetical protein
MTYPGVLIRYQLVPFVGAICLLLQLQLRCLLALSSLNSQPVGPDLQPQLLIDVPRLLLLLLLVLLWLRLAWLHCRWLGPLARGRLAPLLLLLDAVATSPLLLLLLLLRQCLLLLFASKRPCLLLLLLQLSLPLCLFALLLPLCFAKLLLLLSLALSLCLRWLEGLPLRVSTLALAPVGLRCCWTLPLTRPTTLA